MASDHQSLFADSYLRAEFGSELETFQGSEEEQALLVRLRHWASRELQNETSAQNAFIDRFFKQVWGYVAAGERDAEQGYTCYPQFAVGRAGATGGTGQADLALGLFGTPSLPPIPQALCEFKDIRSGLDTPQRRKNDTRSPVRQCADYLRESAAGLFGNEPVQPHWGIVTDMNEFRLYRRISMPTQYQRFVISPKVGDDITSLLGEGREASFQRLLFSRLFHVDRLISAGGDPPLINDLKKQFIHERALEQSFYKEYRAYRERLIEALRFHNPHFTGTRGRLVRLAQTVLDRCIFVLFCEDMGRSLSFPPSLLRDYLSSRSSDPYYEANGEEIWTTLRRLFAVMNSGGQFLTHTINRFNGGLFAHDTELEALHIPNSVFCQPNQGASAANIRAFPQTLLYFSGNYNFGNSSEGRAITLYTLGRIFEQSITELEALEAEADGRPSLTKVTKRKRDGVYYTPEWVVGKIVEETVGTRLADLRRDANWNEALVFEAADIQRQPATLRRQVEAIDRYRDALERVTIVDPACGSGAFLIHALEYLLRERRRVGLERERLSQRALLFDQEEQIREILSRNIYGVDINPASIEITRLALWLHTARADRPLCDLDRNIRDGNSLIDPVDFARWDEQMLLLPPEEHERINPFDWWASFPEVATRGGFDCVIGNPPYVKLQNFRKVLPQVAEFLREARTVEGAALYQSAQEGNFDVFLPFIEKGIGLLNEHGRMGFIAPSLWLLNEYGAALRSFIHEGQYLDRWIDFKSFQVFEEATTYTALQFFTRSRNPSVRFALAPDGALSTDWRDAAWHVPYAELSTGDDTWVFLPENERRLVRRLSHECLRLDDPLVTTQIFQGLITSADHIYHLKRLRAGLYESRANRGNARQIEIEDAIMRPLISGTEADRYAELETDLYLLFPYESNERGMSLLSAIKLSREFPLAWDYLRQHEQELRDREGGSFDDEQWYRFGRNQNIDKQNLPKLAVAQTVQHLEVSCDLQGEFCLNNVRVNGILCEDQDNLLFLMGILNSPVPDWIFRRSSAPKSGGFFEANKQFIAPLPIPHAPIADKRWIGTQALELTTLHGRFRQLIWDIEHRLEVCDNEKRSEDWLLSGVGSIEDWKRRAPEMGARLRTQWAKEKRSRQLSDELASLQMRLSSPTQLRPHLANGELSIESNGVVVIDHVFVSADEGAFLLAQWKLSLWDLASGAAPIASKVVDLLRNVKLSGNTVLKAQVVEMTEQAFTVRNRIDTVEQELNDRIAELYHLTPDERALIATA
jgi:hypothetical protein